MPKTHEMKESNFLKKEDVGRGMLGTISGVVKKNVAMEGAAPDFKWCMTFQEADKPLVLNSTNIQLIENICGSDDTDDWIGKRIVLYTDPNVSFAGKLVGGIRVRAPKKTAPPPPPPKPEPEPSESAEDEMLADDDIPF